MNNDPNMLYTRGDGDAPAHRFDWMDVLVAVTTTIVQMLGALTRGVDMVDDEIRAHANWKRSRAAWGAKALEDIEKP